MKLKRYNSQKNPNTATEKKTVVKKKKSFNNPALFDTLKQNKNKK